MLRGFKLLPPEKLQKQKALIYPTTFNAGLRLHAVDSTLSPRTPLDPAGIFSVLPDSPSCISRSDCIISTERKALETGFCLLHIRLISFFSFFWTLSGPENNYFPRLFRWLDSPSWTWFLLYISLLAGVLQSETMEYVLVSNKLPLGGILWDFFSILRITDIFVAILMNGRIVLQGVYWRRI